MSDTSTGNGKVVVNRAMSLDGFIAAPGHVMDWGGGRQLTDFVAPDDFRKIAAATGAMLVGRRTSDVGSRMEAEKPGSVDYPFSGPHICPHPYRHSTVDAAFGACGGGSLSSKWCLRVGIRSAFA